MNKAFNTKIMTDTETKFAIIHCLYENSSYLWNVNNFLSRTPKRAGLQDGKRFPQPVTARQR